MQTKKKNIVLIGFMGTGKTTVGKILAQKAGFTFVDMDEYIEQSTNRKIFEIFQTDGEDFFRKLECETVEKLANKSRLVIATGGGTIKSEINRKFLKSSGIIVCLEADAETIFQRTKTLGKRPLLDKEPDRRLAIQKLFEQRKEIYRGAADCLIDTSESLQKSPLMLANEILEKVRANLKI